MRILRDRIKFISCLSIFTLLFLALGSMQAYAQDEPDSFSNVQLWLYPEYDDPRLLVMLEGRIEGTEPPAEVHFLVPSTAEMYSAGSMDAQGNYSGGPPDREPSFIPGWDQISYQVTTDTFRVEYYDPIISGSPEKSISYIFRSLYPVSDMEMIVQEPIGAADFTVAPDGDKFVDVAGFNSYLSRYTDLDPETVIQIDITYTRTATAPSLSLYEDTLTPSPSLPEENETFDSLWIVIILAVVAVIIIAAFVLRRKTAPVTKAERHRAARRNIKSLPQDSKLTPKFCSQCGNPIDKNHKFCPSCGTEIH